MITTIVKLFLGPLVDTVTDIVDMFVRKEMTKEEIRAKVKQEILKTLTTVASKDLEARKDVLVAEMRGENWLQRNWRPMVAVTFAFSYLFVIVWYPFFVAWGILPQVNFGEKGLENVYYLVISSVGGYMGLRTVEKIVKMWR